MKNKAQIGHWKYHTKRVFLGAFLPALASYFVLYFLLSFQMTSTNASWLALFITAGVWNYCNYLMGYMIHHNPRSGSDDEDWLTHHTSYEPCRSDDHNNITPLSNQDYRSPADPAHPNNWSNPYNPSSFNHH